MYYLKRSILHIALGTIIFFVLAFVTGRIYANYALHDEYCTVPNLIGEDSKNVVASVNEKFQIIISDSVYRDDLPRGSVISQAPEPNNVVKPGRTIFLSVNALQAPTTNVPNLVDRSPRMANQIIESLGFKQSEPITIQDTFPIVLKVLYDGKEVEAGERVPLGSKFQLVVGSGIEESGDTTYYCVENMQFRD